MIGPYSLVLHYSGHAERAFQTFTVAAYRKPEFEVDVQPKRSRYLSGEMLYFGLKASYYFGAAVPQAAVRWTIRRENSVAGDGEDQDRWFYGGDGNMYPEDNYRLAPFVAEGSGATDNQGHLDIKVHSDPKAEDSVYSLTLTLTDSSRRQVTATSSVPAYAAALRLGISSQRQIVSIGDLIPVRLQLLDLDRNPHAGHVHLSIIAPIWNQKTGKWHSKVLASKDVQVSTTGYLSANLPALAYGDISILAETTDASGRRTSAFLPVWVASMNAKLDKVEDEPTVDLKIDKHVYKPGESVHAYAMTNRPKNPILFVMTGGDIWHYKVIQPHGALVATTFSTSNLLSPNAYLYAEQWDKGNFVPRSVVVPIPDHSRLLKVTLTPDQTKYKPGDPVTYAVKVTDSSGHGVSAEVSVAVVDEAIYALSTDITPDPFKFFWGLREDKVMSFQSAPEEFSGGAFQNVGSMAPIRQRFEDTAFWTPVVVTDKNGDASVRFFLPGNLTSWRATARAFTTDTRVGSVKRNVLASRPVTLRLAAPRMASQGDRVTILGTVNNRSETPLTFDTFLRVDGAQLEGGQQKPIHTPANSEG